MGGGEECCFQRRLASAGGHVAQGNSALLRRPDGHCSVLQPHTVPHLPTLIDHGDFFNPTFSSLMIISPASLELFISVPGGSPSMVDVGWSLLSQNTYSCSITRPGGTRMAALEDNLKTLLRFVQAEKMTRD